MVIGDGSSIIFDPCSLRMRISPQNCNLMSKNLLVNSAVTYTENVVGYIRHTNLLLNSGLIL